MTREKRVANRAIGDELGVGAACHLDRSRRRFGERNGLRVMIDPRYWTSRTFGFVRRRRRGMTGLAGQLNKDSHVLLRPRGSPCVADQLNRDRSSTLTLSPADFLILSRISCLTGSL